jgi:hypothetical protein
MTAGRSNGFNRIVWLGATALSLWSLVLPTGTGLLLFLTLAPPVAIAAAFVSGDRVALLPSRGGRKRNLAPLLLLPPLGAAMSAQFDYSVRDVAVGAVFAGLIAILLTAGVVAASTRARPDADLRAQPLRIAALLLFTGLPYGWGMAVHWNGRLDGAPPVIEPRVVIAKTPTAIRQTAWYLTLAPDRARWRVTSDVAARAVVGSPACLVTHPGAFGIRYREVRICGDVRR